MQSGWGKATYTDVMFVLGLNLRMSRASATVEWIATLADPRHKAEDDVRGKGIRPSPPPIDEPLEIRVLAASRDVEAEHACERAGKRAVFAEAAFV